MLEETTENVDRVGGGECNICGCIAFDNPDKTKACVGVDVDNDPGLCLHSYTDHALFTGEVDKQSSNSTVKREGCKDCGCPSYSGTRPGQLCDNARDDTGALCGHPLASHN